MISPYNSNLAFQHNMNFEDFTEEPWLPLSNFILNEDEETFK